MPWINHLPPVCWSTFGILVWNDSGYVNLTQWWYFFIIFEYILHISTPHIMIFCFPLPYFPLSTSALFLLSTLVLTLYRDVFLSLSIYKSLAHDLPCNHTTAILNYLDKFWDKMRQKIEHLFNYITSQSNDLFSNVFRLWQRYFWISFAYVNWPETN